MNAETFCEHFATFADAPNAIPKLRELIFQLAVQGKVVSQDKNDEPASVLFSKIQAEREELIARRAIRRSKPLRVVDAAEVPFEIPATWLWVRFDDVGDWGAGATPNRGRPDYFGGEIKWFKSGELNDAYIDDSEEKITAIALKECSLRENQPGDVMVAMYGATIGKVAILNVAATTNQAVCACTCHTGVFNRYLFLMLKAFKPYFISNSSGAAQPNFSKEKIVRTPFPLPPLAEQRRIVEKVDQLLGLCDELAARQAAQREKRQRLVGATLDRLVTCRRMSENAREGEAPAEPQSTRIPRKTARQEPRPPKMQSDFQTHAHRLRNHFDQLFDTPTTIPQLRQTMLQLAVQGQLATQDPNDEPAEELRLRVLGSLCDTIDDDQRRRIEKLSDVTPDDGPFDLPPGWTWARFPELGRFGRGKSRHRPRNEPKLYTDGIYPLVQTGDVARANGWIKTHTGKYNEFGLEQSRLWPVGTMCITIAANIADSGRLSFEACIPDSVVGFIPAAEIQDASYFEFFMRTAKARLEDYAPSTAQKNINLGILDAVLIPFPPLSEQKRIVTKVTELLSLCDALEAKLTQAESASTQLLSAAVHHLLNGAATNV